MNKARVAFKTFGCKLNFSESSALSRELAENGYNPVAIDEKADIYVIHTCAVTSQAESKCRKAIRQAKRKNPDSIVAVMGCYSQLQPEYLAGLEETDMIIGNAEKFALQECLKLFRTAKTKGMHVSDVQTHTDYFPAFSSGDRTRSFLKVQDGCDYFCSYCTIPMARGRSRSQPVSETMKLAEKAAATNAREIVLTGVNIGDYGKNTKENLSDLMSAMENLDNADRIRISSIEPDLLTDEIIDHIASSGKFMPHLHLPLQSGSDAILKLMNRNYDTELYRDRVRRIKDTMPHACIAADVITGFPGETDLNFKETCNFIDSLDISYVHVFTYSERPGTKAARMKNKVPPREKKSRSHYLHILSAKKKQYFYGKNRGRKVPVLFESDIQKGHMYGWSDNYIRVKRPYNPDFVNKIIPVTINRMDNNGIFFCNETSRE